VAHAVPTTDACGFSGCLTSAHTVLFTELVYTGSVNSSSGLPKNNYILPQLTDYFPSGNPLRSCTTASLVVYTPNAQPALVKRQEQDQLVFNPFPGAPALTSTISYTVEANRVDNSPPALSSTSDSSGESSAKVTGVPTTSSIIASTSPPSAQQGAQTGSSASSSPSSSATAIIPSTTASAQGSTPGSDQTGTGSSDYLPSGDTQASTTEVASSITALTQESASGGESSLGTTTLAGTVAGTAGNSSSPQPSTWNFVCSSEGCRLASSSETTASNSSASSTSAGGVSQTTSQGSSVRVDVSYGIVSIVLAAILLAMA
jgi:hypothetical protein